MTNQQENPNNPKGTYHRQVNEFASSSNPSKSDAQNVSNIPGTTGASSANPDDGIRTPKPQESAGADWTVSKNGDIVKAISDLISREHKDAVEVEESIGTETTILNEDLKEIKAEITNLNHNFSNLLEGVLSISDISSESLKELKHTNELLDKILEKASEKGNGGGDGGGLFGGGPAKGGAGGGKKPPSGGGPAKPGGAGGAGGKAIAAEGAGAVLEGELLGGELAAGAGAAVGEGAIAGGLAGGGLVGAGLAAAAAGVTYGLGKSIYDTYYGPEGIETEKEKLKRDAIIRTGKKESELTDEDINVQQDLYDKILEDRIRARKKYDESVKISEKDISEQKRIDYEKDYGKEISFWEAMTSPTKAFGHEYKGKDELVAKELMRKSGKSREEITTADIDKYREEHNKVLEAWKSYNKDGVVSPETIEQQKMALYLQGKPYLVDVPDGKSKLTPSQEKSGTVEKTTNSGNDVQGSEFTKKMYTTLLESAKKKGIENPEIIAQLGTYQSALETGYGKYVPSNNYFGIKSTKPGTDFERHGSMEDSAEKYIDFLIRNKRYKETLQSKDIDEAIVNIGRSGYAPDDPDYANKLHNIKQKHSQLDNSKIEKTPDQSSQDINKTLYEKTKEAQQKGVAYKYGASNSETGAVDCSAWVSEQTNKAFNAIGKPKELQETIRAMNSQRTAAGIVQSVGKSTGEELSGDDVNVGNLKEGMVIGLDYQKNGEKSGAGRYKGIDHIVQVVRDPKTGKLQISEASSSAKGIRLTDADEWIKRTENVEKFAVDPYKNIRNVEPKVEMVKEGDHEKRDVKNKPPSISFDSKLFEESAKSPSLSTNLQSQAIEEKKESSAPVVITQSASQQSAPAVVPTPVSKASTPFDAKQTSVRNDEAVYLKILHGNYYPGAVALA